jgi:hypothetical protein
MRFVVVAALALTVVAGAAARPAARPLFELGRFGGNIQPYAVTIYADGTLGSTGPVRLAKPHAHLSQTRLAMLVRYARTQGFWSLPPRTFCPDSLPDLASQYVTVHTATKTRTVRVRGSCSIGFTRIYRALSAAATLAP